MQIESINRLKIAYMRRVGPYGVENKILMEKFKHWVKSVGLFQGSTILGIALDDPQTTPPNECRFDACLVIHKSLKNSNIPQRELLNGNYAVFKISHTPMAVKSFYEKLGQIIKNNELATVPRPIIERYQQKLVSAGYCEILIPIE